MPSFVYVTIPFLILLLAIALPFCPHPFLPEDEHPFVLADYVQTDQKRNIVVTGACSGLGYATVQHLARLPSTTIIMACRNMNRCIEGQGLITDQAHETTILTCLEMDLSSMESIRSFATKSLPERLKSTSLDDSSIHILVNNAGQWSPTPELTFDAESNMETHMLVNHIGHVYLTHLLWQKLAKGARIVTVTSAVTIFPVNATNRWYKQQHTTSSYWYPGRRFLQHVFAYSRSKRANIQFAAELHHRFNHSIVSIATHPGYTRTALLTRGMQFASWLGTLMNANHMGSMSPLQGAMTQVRAALDNNLESGLYIGPKYFSYGPAVLLGRVYEWTLHHWLFSRRASRELWEASLKVLGIVEFGQV